MTFVAAAQPFPVAPLLAAIGLTLAGCERVMPAAAEAPPGDAPRSAYLAPPQVTAASLSGATVTLQGSGRPLARIRLARPDGSAIGATVEANGRWIAPLPPAASLQLFSLSQDVDGRLLRAVGYVAVAPSGPVAVLRPGAGATVVSPTPRPAITAVDYDAAGAAIVSGRAAPTQPVRLGVDGVEAGEARSDAGGRFSISLPAPVRGGAHAVSVRTPSATASAGFTSAPARVAAPPFAAARIEGGWRLDWITPGGGVQTTLLFAPAGAPA